MGTPIPPPIIPDPVPPGVPCTIGWGPDKPFGDGPTPESITVTMSTDSSANGTGILTQIVQDPCFFLGLIDTWSVGVGWSLTGSIARANPLGFPVDFLVQTTDLFVTKFLSLGDFLHSPGSLFVFFPEVE